MSWLVNGSKLVDLEEGQAPYFYGERGDRAAADLGEKTLILKNVTPGDSGEYRATLLLQGQLFHKDFRLQVYDHVCPVRVSADVAGDSVTLQCSCSGPGPPPSWYEWRSSGGPVFNTTQNITVPTREDPQPITCVARNEVTNTSDTFSVPAKSEDVGGRSLQALWVLLLLFLLFVVLGWYYREKIRGFLPCLPKTTEDPIGNVEETAGLNPEPTESPKGNGHELVKQNPGHYKENGEEAAELNPERNEGDPGSGANEE
ncbi:uncharacterized protein [Engystomops pustulosus]